MKDMNSYGEIMSARLHVAEQKAKTILERSSIAISVIEEILAELNPILSETRFDLSSEEIHFFKQQLPAIHAQLIYHLSVIRLESRKPVGDAAIHRHYYSGELDRIRHYSEDHRDFYQYYRTGATFWDEYLFLRGHEPLPQLQYMYSYAIDGRTCTTGSMMVATIQAYDMLQEFIDQQTSQLDNRPPASAGMSRRPLKWTDSKTGLAELIYALWFKGAFNNGAAELKDIQAYFEHTFGISVGNIYQIKQEMYARENLCAYQDLLHKRFKEGMEDSV